MKNVLLTAALSLLALAPALAQTTEVRPVANFHAIDVSTGIELTLTSGDTERVEASADTPEALGHLKTTVSDGVLRVKFEWLKSQPWRGTNHGHHLRVAVTAAQLTGIEASSGASVKVQGTYPTSTLDLQTSSGASLKGDFTATSLLAHLSSGSEMVVTGTTKLIEVHTSSGSSFSGKRLQAEECQATASSGASVVVGVQSTLSAEASSGGSVSYLGSPQVSKHTSSGGSVEPD
ncbi:MAG: head GIN domain-containing protein [Janthinobacterium lividum]